MKKIWDKIKSMDKKTIKILLIILIVSTTLAPALFLQNRPNSEDNKKSYTEFITLVDLGIVTKVYYDYNSPTIKFDTQEDGTFVTDNPRDIDFKKELLLSGVEVEEEVNSSDSVFSFLAFVIQIGLMVMIFMYTIRHLKKMSGGNSQANNNLESPNHKQANITFNNIAGNEEAKEEMQFLVEFLKNPKKYTDAGAKLPKGVIFYGPPGTGKTLMAKAIAGEANVPFFSVSGSDFLEMYVGLGARRVRALFEKARKNAPCIIFIDEIDAVGGKRGMDMNSERDQTINALLNEMDGYNGSEGIIVIAGTNIIEKLDHALIRPGRFDKHIPIGLPDCNDRYEILKVHSKNKKFNEEVDLKELAKMTIGFAGAGLEALLNEAVILSINRGHQYIRKQDIDDAYFKIVMQGDKKKNRKDRQIEEIELVAWHEAGHALCAKLITNNEIPKVTIIPTTSGAGGVTLVTPRKMGLHSKRELLNDIIVYYAGRASEYILLGSEDKITTGAYNDIKVASENIKKLISYYGMSDTFGLINLDAIGVNNNEIIKEASKLSKELYSEALRLLKENHSSLRDIANALMEKETIDESELDMIIARNSSRCLESSTTVTEVTELNQTV